MAKESSLGILLLVAIGLIVGIVILSEVSNLTNQTTTTNTIANKTVTLKGSGVFVSISDYQAVVGTPTIINYTNGAIVNSPNYTIQSNIVNGAKVLQIAANTSEYANMPINFSGTIEPFGYAEDSGSRAIIPLIVILSALALVAFVMWPVIREYMSFS